MKIMLTAIAMILVGSLCWFVWKINPFTTETSTSSLSTSGNAAEIGPRGDDEKQMTQVANELMLQKMQVAALQRQLNDLQHPPETGGAENPRGDTTTGAENNHPAEISMEEQRKLDQKMELERSANLDAIMSRQTPDSSWSAEVIQKANEWIDSTAQPAQITSLTCGRNFCRADVYHDDQAFRMDVMNELTASPPFDTNGFVYVKDPAAPSTIVYFAREGFSLAEIEAAEPSRSAPM